LVRISPQFARDVANSAIQLVKDHPFATAGTFVVLAGLAANQFGAPIYDAYKNYSEKKLILLPPDQRPNSENTRLWRNYFNRLLSEQKQLNQQFKQELLSATNKDERDNINRRIEENMDLIGSLEIEIENSKLGEYKSVPFPNENFSDQELKTFGIEPTSFIGEIRQEEETPKVEEEPQVEEELTPDIAKQEQAEVTGEPIEDIDEQVREEQQNTEGGQLDKAKLEDSLMKTDPLLFFLLNKEQPKSKKDKKDKKKKKSKKDKKDKKKKKKGGNRDWIEHVNNYRKEHGIKNFFEAMKPARKTYKK
jgi:hypothetical protein